MFMASSGDESKLNSTTGGRDLTSNNNDDDSNTKKDPHHHFDLLPLAPSDHHYLTSSIKAPSDKNLSQSLHSTMIMKEWNILEKNLPESIYVQAYENRIDLLRAVIVGSPETPYHNGLFFFDLLFPPNYPNEPPKVHYQSRGYRINPNLYANGTVCLSLIHTWPGQCVAERWNRDSTVLQLLVSVQGLVLNGRPFFNEPCYSHARESLCAKFVAKSIEYNYQVVLDSCRTMLLVVRKPPEGFEGFVAWHFERRAEAILAFVKSYIKDRAWAGQLPSGAASVPLDVSTKACKVGLVWARSDLKKEFGKLKSRGDDDQGKIMQREKKKKEEVVADKEKEKKEDKKEEKKKKTKGLLSKLRSLGKCIYA